MNIWNFSYLITGLRRNHNTQHFSLKILENFKEALDKDNTVSAIFMDLSKALIAWIMTY